MFAYKHTKTIKYDKKTIKYVKKISLIFKKTANFAVNSFQGMIFKWI